MFATLRKRHGPHGRQSGPGHGAPLHLQPLPALSICRLEAPEELLKKLRQHAEDPALAEFTCPICWEPFWQPVRTVCGHAFCEGCLLKSVLAQLGHDQPDVSCPLCRHPLHVDDVSADEALLTRIRLVIAQKTREVETPSTGRASGRLFRGSTRSPNLETPFGRSLHCTGQPCPHAPLERAQTSGMTKRPVLASWMRVAPADELRPATSSCGRSFQGTSSISTQSPLFVQSSFVARPSTTGAWSQPRHNVNSMGETLGQLRQPNGKDTVVPNEETQETQETIDTMETVETKPLSRAEAQSLEVRQANFNSRVPEWIEMDDELSQGHVTSAPSAPSCPQWATPPETESSQTHTKQGRPKQGKQTVKQAERPACSSSLPPARELRLERRTDFRMASTCPRTARRDHGRRPKPDLKTPRPRATMAQ